MYQSVKRVAITGAAGNIAYSLLFQIASGQMFGPSQPVALHLLETPAGLNALGGVAMELEDCAYPLLHEIHIGTNASEIFNGVHYALLIGALPRGPGMERSDLLGANAAIFVEQGKALDAVADRNVHVLVVGNPCNTNCLIASHHAKSLKKENFHAMTRLDENRAVAQLAKKAGVLVSNVKGPIIWGNHSSTQVPDVNHATILSRPVRQVLDASWLEGEFVSTVQKRGAAIIASRGKSSAASAANAIVDAIRAIECPTSRGEWFSSAVSSDKNPYGIQEGIFFSFPCFSERKGEVHIVPDLSWSPFVAEKMKITEKELLEERDIVASLGYL